MVTTVAVIKMQLMDSRCLSNNIEENQPYNLLMQYTYSFIANLNIYISISAKKLASNRQENHWGVDKFLSFASIFTHYSQ